MASHGSRALGVAIFNTDLRSDAIGLLDVSIREEAHREGWWRCFTVAKNNSHPSSTPQDFSLNAYRSMDLDLDLDGRGLRKQE